MIWAALIIGLGLIGFLWLLWKSADPNDNHHDSGIGGSL